MIEFQDKFPLERTEGSSNFNSISDVNIYFATVDINSVISDLEESFTEGIEWGSNVGIAFTATMLAISLLAYLFNRNT